MLIEFLGFLAALLTTLASVPQLIKMMKTRSAGDISILTLTMLGGGVVCWLIYGILISSMPLIAANGFNVIVGSFLLFFKYKYDKELKSKK
jgi:MtN3 and saliva related transmembrane protein